MPSVGLVFSSILQCLVMCKQGSTKLKDLCCFWYFRFCNTLLTLLRMTAEPMLSKDSKQQPPACAILCMYFARLRLSSRDRRMLDHSHNCSVAVSFWMHTGRIHDWFDHGQDIQVRSFRGGTNAFFTPVQFNLCRAQTIFLHSVFNVVA